MKLPYCCVPTVELLMLVAPLSSVVANTSVQTIWRWHLPQPIHWPDRHNYGADPCENTWDTKQQQKAATAVTDGGEPTAIERFLADDYFKITDVSKTFADYFASAPDARSNTFKSPIQHAWVGTGSGGGSGSGGGGFGLVTLSPAPPVAGNTVIIQHIAAGRRAVAARLQP